jgi:predicted hydrolase (HD superfamily)
VDRAIIRECEAAGLGLEEFVQLALDAMRAIAPDLGL